jgi:mannose-6-phosphate isomerase class I
MQHLHFEPVNPEILHGTERNAHEKLFAAPVPDFELSRIQLSTEDTFHLKKQEGPAIYIILKGKLHTELGELQSGDIFFSPHGAEVRLEGLEEADVFRAGVPV